MSYSTTERLFTMLVDWPTETFVLRLHRIPGLVAGAPAGSPEGTPVVLGPETGGDGEQWVAERFRVINHRIRHVATGLYLTAEESSRGATVTLRPKFPDTGSDSSYWRQAWRAFVQRDTGRLMALHDSSNCLLGLADPAAERPGGPLVLEKGAGAEDRSCTAWAPAPIPPPKPAPAPAPKATDLPVGTGRVRVPARRFEKHVRTIEQIFDETSFREVPGELLAPGTRIEAFDFDQYSQGDWYKEGREGSLVTFTDSYETAGAARRAFHRLPGEPARYVDSGEVDVHYVPPKLVARTNFPAALYADVSGALVRTPHRLANGHGFYNQPERREGLYFPKRDGAGTVVQWNKTWIADNDTTSKVFLCFDGRYFIDQMDITWAEGGKS
ncbi:RICIN domain-containing protein [Kitasatospora sp. NPDC059812]|uniref:RICIN domain-containing protein n=1 Tax=Kitasatospora sp. NPDC059812 TaxID=3346958 RepID=UPI0036470BEE